MAAVKSGENHLYNFFSQNLDNNKVQFPAERQFIVLASQHGHRDVTYKAAIYFKHNSRTLYEENEMEQLRKTFSRTSPP